MDDRHKMTCSTWCLHTLLDSPSLYFWRSPHSRRPQLVLQLALQMHRPFFPLICFHFSQWSPAFPRMPSTQKAGINLLDSALGFLCGWRVNGDKDRKSKRASCSSQKQVNVQSQYPLDCCSVVWRTELLFDFWARLCRSFDEKPWPC